MSFNRLLFKKKSYTVYLWLSCKKCKHAGKNLPSGADLDTYSYANQAPDKISVSLVFDLHILKIYAYSRVIQGTLTYFKFTYITVEKDLPLSEWMY
jgi:hypothetical protein